MYIYYYKQCHWFILDFYKKLINYCFKYLIRSQKVGVAVTLQTSSDEKNR